MCYLSQLKHLDMIAIADCLRKAREAPLIHKAKTRAIMTIGRNHRDSAGEWTNVTNYNHYVIFILFSIYFS